MSDAAAERGAVLDAYLPDRVDAQPETAAADTPAEHPPVADATPGVAETGTAEALATDATASRDAPEDSPLGMAEAGRADAPDLGQAEVLALDAAVVADAPMDRSMVPDVPLAEVADVGPAEVAPADRPSGDASSDGAAPAPCHPVAAGAPVSFPVSGTIRKLVAHPSACRMFGLDMATPSHLLVFDTAQKQELTRLELGALATDVDLSPDGAHLVVSLDNLKQLALVDQSSWSIATIPTAVIPRSVEVATGGFVYYAVPGSWSNFRRISLAGGLTSDVDLGVTGTSYSSPDLELSSDGRLLFSGGCGSTSSHVEVVDVSVTPPLAVGKDRWAGGFGFSLPACHAYLGPSGRYVYYADYQLDAADLNMVRGTSGKVLAENAAATFAVSVNGVLDAALLTTLASFAAPISAAALTAADSELWTFAAGTGLMTCTNVADLIAGNPLGAREQPAGSLDSYAFTKLVADPVRPRLYGLDASQRVVVALDSQTGAPLRSVLVGSGPTDLEIDAAGAYLYTGHKDTLAIAQIKATSFTFKQFITTRWDNYDIAPVGADRIASIDESQWTTPSLIDLGSGALLSYVFESRYGGVVAATADGNALFVADNPGFSNPIIVRYDVSAGTLRKVSESAGLTAGTSSRTLVATPDGSSVYYAGKCLNGTNLTEIRYDQPDTIRAMAPDGQLAASATTVYRVSDGGAVATLPAACSVQSFSADGTTLLCADAGSLTRFDVRGLN